MTDSTTPPTGPDSADGRDDHPQPTDPADASQSAPVDPGASTADAVDEVPADPGPAAAEPPARTTRAQRRKADTEAEAEESEGSGKKKKKGSIFKEIGILVVVALVLSVLLQTFVARVYLIPSQSMEPTLHGCAGCTGDRIVVDKLTYRFSDPKPGDVVVFRGPESWDKEFSTHRSSNTFVRGLQEVGSFVGLVAPDENDLVKRIIATGGQTVQCLPGDAGVTVDGKVLDEPYLMTPPSTMPGANTPCQGRNFGPVTVPDGNVWVMGDNRTDSADSRYHIGDELQGTVPESNIIGKARWIVLPFSRIGSISSHDPQN